MQSKIDKARALLRDYARIAEWARAKGPSEYEYLDCQSCALAQYLRDHGIEASLGGFSATIYVRTDILGTVTLSEVLSDAAYKEPRTFSALAERLSRQAGLAK